LNLENDNVVIYMSIVRGVKRRLGSNGKPMLSLIVLTLSAIKAQRAAA
jgi:hypothetical protein